MSNDRNEELVDHLIRTELHHLGYEPGDKVSRGDLLTAKLRACHRLLLGACENDMNKSQQ
jgi:hypothetical protein